MWVCWHKDLGSTIVSPRLSLLEIFSFFSRGLKQMEVFLVSLERTSVAGGTLGHASAHEVTRGGCCLVSEPLFLLAQSVASCFGAEQMS